MVDALTLRLPMAIALTVRAAVATPLLAPTLQRRTTPHRTATVAEVPEASTVVLVVEAVVPTAVEVAVTPVAAGGDMLAVATTNH